MKARKRNVPFDGKTVAGKNELAVSASVAAVSLLTAAVCHRYLPGFGPALKPLLWPLAVLPFCVRLRTAAPTAFAVPLLSALVNGMPSLGTAALLSVAAAIGVAVLRLLVDATVSAASRIGTLSAGGEE